MDILPLDELNSGKSNLNSIERKNELNKLSKKFDNVIKLVDYEVINFDDEKGQKKFERQRASRERVGQKI